MIRLRIRVLGILAVLLLVLPLLAGVSEQPALAQDDVIPALAEAMPDTVQVFASTDFDLANDQYIAATALTARLVLPGAGKTIAILVREIAGLLGIIPDDARSALEGEIGIGLLGLDETTGQRPGTPVAVAPLTQPRYAVVLHPNDIENARETITRWFTRQAKTQGVELERTELGTTIVLAKPAGTPVSFPASPAVVIFAGDYVFLGADETALLPFVEATEGKIPALADSRDLSTLAAVLPTERLLFGYVDGTALTRHMTAAFGASSLATAIDPPVGITAFTIAAADAGLRFESVSLPIGETASLSNRTTVDPDFASQLPDTTLAMVTGQELGQSWASTQLQKAILSFVMSAMGGGEVDLSDAGLATQFGVLSMLTGIDFKTDLMDQLQGRWGAALFSLDTEQPLSSSAVISSELGDVDRVSIAVTSLGPLLQSAAAGSVSITTASVAGQTINNVTLLDQTEPATVQYGVVDQQLMVGLGDGIEQLTQQPASTLASDPEYQAALAELPDDYSSLVYLDPRGLAQQLAPTLIEQFASNSHNVFAQCLVANTEFATPIPVEPVMGRTAGTLCTLIGWVFGENSLQDFIVSRLPGPFVAVSYQSGDLQHVSGILLVGE